MNLCVPNCFPTIPSTRRIAIIGDAPSRDDVTAHEPFSGYAGQRLNKLLEIAGHSRSSCFLGNISQHRPSPTSDHLELLSYETIYTGCLQLKQDLDNYNPNLILLLGNLALKTAMDFSSTHSLKPNTFRNKVTNWRGSLFVCEDPASPFYKRKCLPSYHPAYCLRDFEKMPLLTFDVKKAVKHSTTPNYEPPKRLLTSSPTFSESIHNLTLVNNLRTRVALDIEGGVDTMSCISFTLSETNAFIIPLTRKDGQSYFSADEEITIWRLLAQVLENPLIPKVLQNSLYDRFVLAYSYGIRVQGVVDDTMLYWWELYSELPKSLGVQTSILTDEPYYKSERKANDDKTFYEYCCKDSAVTLEICNSLDRFITGASLNHYHLNVSLLNPLLYMELRGIRYDVGGALQRRTALQSKLYEAQAQLNTIFGLPAHTIETITQHVYATLLKKNTPTTTPLSQWFIYAYAGSGDEVARLVNLLQTHPCSLAVLGEIETILGLGLNVGSNKQMCEFFYGTLQLPQQKADVKGETDEDGNPKEAGDTVNYEALLNLTKHLTLHPNSCATEAVRLAIEIRSLATRQRMLGISADRDIRIRCGYNIVGSNTGRITCYESPTGSGYNLQTIPNYTNIPEAPGGVLGDRDLFVADDGCWFFQCDLKGADGWTVAAYSAMLGDRTMLDDYLFGLKPANIVTLMLRSIQGDYKDRAWLKQVSKQVEKDAWDYFACKRVQHGVCYLEGPLTVSRNILKDSEGKCHMSVAECKQLSNLFFTRYWGVRKYHDYISRQLKVNRGTPYLVAASGQKRYFFGRPDEILTKAVAFEPQANTTYATNLAMHKLWNDPDNRTFMAGVDGQQPSHNPMQQLPPCKLRIEPLHQVHDALCGQFAKVDTAWAVSKVKSYFDNKIKIAGIELVIPFDGAFGESWGNLKEGVI